MLMSDIGDFLKKKDALLDFVLHSTSVMLAAMGSEPLSRPVCPWDSHSGRRVQLGSEPTRRRIESSRVVRVDRVRVALFIRTE